MKVQIANADYIVKWQHHNTTILGTSKKIPKSYTLCWIEKDNKLVTEAKALLHPGDRYQKDKGRKISLKLVLDSFNKPERALFWNEYHKMTHNAIRKAN